MTYFSSRLVALACCASAAAIAVTTQAVAQAGPQPETGSAAVQPDSVTAPAGAAQGNGQASGVEEIVVTAQRREQNLQDVPISITALSSTALAANRIQDVRDLSALVPNLTVRPSSGGAQLPNYILRGIFTGGSAIGTDKGVGLYIDGVYVQAAAGSIFELADIERIEVLKGPQGTLFGRNATGGAISLITRNPTGEFGGNITATYGNFDQKRIRAHVDLPSFGPISIAATYLHSERRGDIRNLGAGTRWDFGPATGGRLGIRTSPKHLGNDNVEGVLAAVKFDFHPDFDLVYKFDFSQSDYTPEGQGVSLLPPGTLRSLYDLQDPALRTPITNKRPNAVNNVFTTPGYNRSMGHNLTGVFRISDEVSIKDILAYREQRVRSTQQGDGLGGLTNTPVDLSSFGLPLVLPPAYLGNPGTQCLAFLAGFPNPATCAQSVGMPFAFLNYNSESTTKQWTNEFQVNISTQWFNLTAGYLYFHAKSTAAGEADLFNVNTLSAYYGQNTPAQGTAFVVPANPGFRPSFATVTSHGVYIQPEFHITDQLDLVAGGRITHDRKRGGEYYPDFRNRPGGTLIAPIVYDNSQANYLIGLNYKPTDNVLVYVKRATGYISGSRLSTLDFAPEKAFSNEAGIKADLFDRRVRTNLSVFHVKYKSIQFATGGRLAGVPAAELFGTVVVPSADARAYGFEWENTVVPIDGLTLGANVGYLNFKFDQDTVFGGTYVAGSGRTGNCFGPTCGDPAVATGGFVAASGAPGYQNFARPKWTANLSAEYNTPEILMGGHLSLRADGNFTSKTLLTSDVTLGTGVTGPASLETPELRAAASVGARWIVNTRAALTNFDMYGTKATLALWSRNLLNNKDIQQFVGIGSVNPVIFERARTYGVDLSVSF